MPRKLTERELRKIERWARGNKKSELLDFFAELPRYIVISRPTLFGSYHGHDHFLTGYTTTSAVIGELWFLDDIYNPIPSVDSFTYVFIKRHERFDSDFWRSRNLGLATKTRKICLTAHLGGCSDKISSAHSVQRSELGKLARADKHVYGFRFGGLTDHRNFSLPELIGINVATTFTGVCSRHDSEIFKPIEDKPFTATRRELFLFHYRALLFGHYHRTYQYKKLERIYEELTAKGHAADFEPIKNILDANKLDRDEVSVIKAQCDCAQTSGACQEMLLAAWTAQESAPIAGTVTLAPIKDFLGTRLQSPVIKKKLQWVTITITPKDERTLIVIGANTHSSVAKQLIDSLNAILPETRMQAFLTYCLCYMEGIILLPHFWENLSALCKEALIRTVQARYYPRKLPSFGQWKLKAVDQK